MNFSIMLLKSVTAIKNFVTNVTKDLTNKMFPLNMFSKVI